MTYWEKRQQQLNSQLEKDETKLKERLSSFYDSEYRKLEKEISHYYQQYGQDSIIQYRKLMDILPNEDKRLLIERMNEFAVKYPQYKDLLPIRESIYKLNRLEGLQMSIRMQQMEIGAVNNEELQKHLERLALRSANETAEMLGFGKNFYSIGSDIVKTTVGAAWANGKNFSQSIWGNTDKLANYLCTDVAQAIARGDSYDRIMWQMKQRFGDVSRNDMNRLIYTEGTYVMAESSMQPFVEDFETYRISTVGDGKVCSICSAAAKEKFDVKDRRPGVTFPPFHTWCRCTFTIEVENWDKWMEDYEARHGTGQGKKVANRLRNDIIEPEDKGDLHTDLGHLSSNLQEQSLQVHTYLDGMDLPKSKWSGKTIIKGVKDMGMSIGRKKRNCDIWLREDAPIKTVIHEHLHARSISRTGLFNMDNLGYEEGVVELLAEELCKRNGVKYQDSYRRYVNPLRELHKAIGNGQDILDFSIELFGVDVKNRESWLKTKVDAWAENNILRFNKRMKMFDLIDSLKE